MCIDVLTIIYSFTPAANLAMTCRALAAIRRQQRFHSEKLLTALKRGVVVSRDVLNLYTVPRDDKFLATAALKGLDDVVKLMLYCGSVVEFYSSSLENAISEAVRGGHFELAKLLIDNTSQDTLYTANGNIIDFAIYAGNIDIVNYLINVTTYKNEFIWSAINYSIHHKNIHFMKYFLDLYTGELTPWTLSIALDLQDEIGVLMSQILLDRGYIPCIDCVISAASSERLDMIEGHLHRFTQRDLTLAISRCARDAVSTASIKKLIDRGGKLLADALCKSLHHNCASYNKRLFELVDINDLKANLTRVCYLTMDNDELRDIVMKYKPNLYKVCLYAAKLHDFDVIKKLSDRINVNVVQYDYNMAFCGYGSDDSDDE